MSCETNKMTKSEFVSRYINDRYNKKRKERQLQKEADCFLIESAQRAIIKKEKSKGRGIYKYER